EHPANPGGQDQQPQERGRVGLEVAAAAQAVVLPSIPLGALAVEPVEELDERRPHRSRSSTARSSARVSISASGAGPPSRERPPRFSQTACTPAARAPDTSSSSESPTCTICCGSQPASRSATANSAGSGLATSCCSACTRNAKRPRSTQRSTSALP